MRIERKRTSGVTPQWVYSFYKILYVAKLEQQFLKVADRFTIINKCSTFEMSPIIDTILLLGPAQDDLVEEQNERLAQELAGKVSRLKNVSYTIECM